MPNLEKLSVAIKRAVIKGLNKTAPVARGIIADEIATLSTIRRADARKLIKNRIGIGFANSRHLKVVLYTKKVAILPLIYFRTEQLPPGVGVEIERGKITMYEHAFIATWRQTRQSVYKRKEFGGKLVPRYPIKTVPGVPVTHFFQRAVNKGDRRVKQLLATNITEELRKMAKTNG